MNVQRLKTLFSISLCLVLLACGSEDIEKSHEEHAQWLTQETSKISQSIDLVSTFLSSHEKTKAYGVTFSEEFATTGQSLKAYSNCFRRELDSKQGCHDSFAKEFKKSRALLENASNRLFKMVNASVKKINSDKSKNKLISKSTKKLILIARSIAALALSSSYRAIDTIHDHFEISFKNKSDSVWSLNWAKVKQNTESFTYNEMPPYLEKGIEIKLLSFRPFLKTLSKESVKTNYQSYKDLHKAFEILNTRELQITDYAKLNTKEIWITKEIEKDALKYAAVLYALDFWKKIFEDDSIFKLMGSLEEKDMPFLKPDGKNVIMMKDNLDVQDIYLWDYLSNPGVKSYLGLTLYKDLYEETDIALNRSGYGKEYCFELASFLYLPSKFEEDKSTPLLDEAMCSVDDTRYNFVALLLHELAHYLGYYTHETDVEHLMFSNLSTGLSDYNIEGIKEYILNNQ
jgi:hypothetical protein